MSIQDDRIYELLVSPFTVATVTANGARTPIKIPVGGYEYDNVTLAYTIGAQHKIFGTPSVQYGTFYTGHKTTAVHSGRIESGNQLGIEPNISVNWVDLPEGRFTDTVISARPTFTMTPRMFVSALVQCWSNATVSTNLRFRWEYQPGSELFLVTPKAVPRSRGTFDRSM